MSGPHVFCDVRLGVHDSSRRKELMARIVPLSSLWCVLSVYQLLLGWESAAIYPGVCLALLQGSCLHKFNRFCFLPRGRWVWVLLYVLQWF